MNDPRLIGSSRTCEGSGCGFGARALRRKDQGEQGGEETEEIRAGA